MERLVFMGTPDFAVPALKALIGRYEIVGVVTQPDRRARRGRKLEASPVKVAALAPRFVSVAAVQPATP